MLYISFNSHRNPKRVIVIPILQMSQSLEEFVVCPRSEKELVIEVKYETRYAWFWTYIQIYQLSYKV